MATTTTPTPNPTQARPAEGGLDRWFEVSARGSTYRTEILGGATTFLTLVYIVFVNPAILSGTADLSGVKLGFEQVLAVTAVAGGLLTIASSNTTFIESNAGLTAGARTGLASLVTGVLLLLCMFISPIAGIIPTEATASALVIVGVMMFSLVRDLRWDNASPLAVFATIIVMPVTYSIANGVGVGIVLHTSTQILNRRRVSPLLIIFSGFFIWSFVHGTI